MPILLFAEFQKAEQRIVVGIASTETIDNQGQVLPDGRIVVGDVVDAEAIKEALADYMQWANIREMHQNSAVGTAVKAEVVEGKLQLTAKVVDDTAWQKVKENVYKGFSIGGKVLKAVLEKLPDGRWIRRILKLKLSEISLVDRPANPDARILLWKGDGLMPDDILELFKAAADPQKIITLIQAARNQCELDGDLEGAALYTQSIALVLQAAGDAETPTEETAESAAEEVPSGEVAMGARGGKLRKVGRKLNAGNMAAMHKVLKALVEMMAGAGDELATKMAAMYAPQEEAKTAVSAPDIAKATGESIVAAFKPYFEQMGKTFQGIETRLAAIEKQPVSGGPVLRSVEKVLAGGQQPVIDQAAARRAARVAELKRLAATEPNQSLRAQYQAELMQLAQ